MAQPASAPMIAVVNRERLMVRMLQTIMQLHGVPSVGTEAEARPGAADAVAAFLTAQDPGVVLFDTLYPYDQYWNLFQEVCRTEAGQGRAFVLTTTNAAIMRAWAAAGKTAAIVEVPFSSEEIMGAVARAPAVR